MIFPTISEITIRDIVTVSDQMELQDAVEVMLITPHSHVVVETENGYSLLEVYDLICYYRIVERHTRLCELQLEPLYTFTENTGVDEAIKLLREGHETFAVTDSHGRFVGVVVQTDLISSVDPQTLMENYRIHDLFKIKKRNRWISPDVLMKQAVEEMHMKQYDAYLIVEHRKPVGILTSKDILRLLQKGINMSRPVSAYMSTPVSTLPADITLKEAIAFMERTGFKRIVTTDESGYLVGSLTYKELLSITYSKWLATITRYQQELRSMNEKLTEKTKEYEVIAAYDALTGLYNRRKFMELFVLEYTVMLERDNAMSVVVIDIDHFKSINDTYGHNTGDSVLKTTATILKKAFRDIDIIARWGGDEFVALLPATNASRAYDIAEERIRKKVAALHITDKPISVSIGIAEVQPGDDVQTAIGRADEMLYEAKRRGRNCVVCHD